MVKLPALRAHRERMALSQRDLAALAKITQTTVWRIERGKDAMPSTARKLARVLKVKPADLMGPDGGEGQQA